MYNSDKKEYAHNYEKDKNGYQNDIGIMKHGGGI